jgi:hypothetical protein
MRVEANDRIYRHEVPVDGRWHSFALHDDPLHVECRRPGVVEFWARWQSGHPGVAREFTVVGTGHPLPDDTWQYSGTALDGSLVWHLIERHPSEVLANPTR